MGRGGNGGGKVVAYLCIDVPAFNGIGIVIYIPLLEKGALRF